jgi:hypothetical protein
VQPQSVSSAWLSNDMAQALTTMFPPLETADVVRAADALAAAGAPPGVVDQLLQQGANLMQARQIVEALAALHDASVMESPLPSWLLAQEIGPEADAAEISAAAERVCQKLSSRFSTLVSPLATQAVLSRALHLGRAEFPFLEEVQAGRPPGVCLMGLIECVQDMGPDEARLGLVAVLGILIRLLVGFIGNDLTMRLLREDWPELPLRVLSRIGTSGGQEAHA